MRNPCQGLYTEIPLDCRKIHHKPLGICRFDITSDYLANLLLFIIRSSVLITLLETLEGMNDLLTSFGYDELRMATADFSTSNKLGQGGFGPVYKGILTDEREIAVKKLSVTSHQGNNQFLAEIFTISAVQHHNIVKLYGYCIEDENRLLVYEYLANKSLNQALYGKNAVYLDWTARYNICLGIARGLACFHDVSNPRIIHRDVKSSNILLDNDLNPKISDFGLAKLVGDTEAHVSTRFGGTVGYIAPEYAMRGRLTQKADVYAFGVVTLEILCGRPVNDSSLGAGMTYLLELVWSLYESGRSLELVDPALKSFNKKEAIRMLGVALLCTQASPKMRPTMSQVVGMLTGASEVAVAEKPSYLCD
ncbi:hypothetical protein ACHQM5_022815 [Ranunculus cassubicifolius]